jgi:Lsr2
MATRTIKVDDFDGKSEGAETVVFAAGGKFYEIDLAAASAKKLDDALAPFVAKAREITAKEATKGASNGHEVDLGAVREWAAAQNPPIQVAPKGRVAAEVVERYLAANPTE